MCIYLEPIFLRQPTHRSRITVQYSFTRTLTAHQRTHAHTMRRTRSATHTHILRCHGWTRPPLHGLLDRPPQSADTRVDRATRQLPTHSSGATCTRQGPRAAHVREDTTCRRQSLRGHGQTPSGEGGVNPAQTAASLRRSGSIADPASPPEETQHLPPAVIHTRI